MRQRERVAAKIEALEGELDRMHQALHRVDEATGLSYRTLLGQLIELEIGSPPLNMPQLRAKLSILDSSVLTTVEEECAPLARYWLPAKFEGSALAHLKAFATDRGTLDEFHVAFKAFLDAEHSRMQILNQHPTQFDVDDPAPHRAWLNENAPRLEALDESQRKRLAHWLPLFRPAEKTDAPGQLLYNALRKLHQELTTEALQNSC